MSDQDTRLISRITLDLDVETALKRGVTADMIQATDCREAFRFITSHHERYRQVPSGTMVRLEFPHLRLVKVQDSIEVVVDAFIAEFRQRSVYEMVSKAVDMLERSQPTADLIMEVTRALENIQQLATASSDVNLMADPMSRFDEYLERKNRPGGLLGTTTGFPTIDRATLGLQPGQLITIIATPKAGKSQLAMKVAHSVHGEGLSPVFQSFEMSTKELEKRFDALAFNLSHNRLLNGDLVQAEEDRYAAGLKSHKGTQPFVLSDSSTGLTVSALGAYAAAHTPDVLFVDGVYLMVDETSGEKGTAQALTNITRSLKRLAQRLEIPVVISTQVLTWKMKKHKIDPNSIGYSSSFYQDSDVILGLERTETEDEFCRLLKIVASRNCGPAEVELDWDWDRGVFQETQPSTAYTYGAP